MKEQGMSFCVCGNCNNAMIYKDNVSRKIKWLVEYELKRRSFYYLECKVYQKPLDKKLEIQGYMTLEVKKTITLLGQCLRLDHFIKNPTPFSSKFQGACYLQMDGEMFCSKESGFKEVRNAILFSSEDRVQLHRHHKRIF